MAETLARKGYTTIMPKQVKKIQALPAQFGAGANTLTQPNSSSAQFTTTGVVSMVGQEQKLVQTGINALTSGVSDAIEFGMDFDEGFTRAEIEQDHAKNINKFLPNENPEEETIELGAANAAEEEAFSLFNSEQAGDPNNPIGGIVIGAVSEAQKNTKKAIAKLNRARTQGRISAEEFIRNSTLITKRAVTNNPTLRDEIIGDTKRLFEIAGVRSHIDSLKSAQKAEADKRKQVITATIRQWEKTNRGPIPLDPVTGLPSETLMRQGIWEESLEREAVENIRDVNELDKEKQLLRVNQMFKPDIFGQTPMQRATYEIASGFVKQFDAEAQNVEEGKLQEFINGVRVTAEELKNNLSNSLNAFTDHERIKNTETTFKAQIDNMVDVLSKSATREDVVKVSNNLVTLMKNKHFREATDASSVNPVLLDMQVKAATIIGRPELIAKHPEVLNSQLNILRLGGGKKPLDVTEENRRDVPEVVGAVAKVVEEYPDNPAAGQLFSNITEAAFDETGRRRTDKEQFDYSEDLIRELASPSIRIGVTKLSPAARAKAFHAMSGMLRILDRNLGKDLIAIRNKNTDIKVQFHDGQLSFISRNNPTDSDQATRRFSERVQNSVRAIANLQGREVGDPAVVETLLSLLPNINAELEANKAEIKAKTSDRLRRPDGTLKGKEGFLGVQKNKAGEDVTERSVEVGIDGIDISIPLMVPSLTAEEIELVVEDKPVTNEIIDKAIVHARERIRQGKSVFKENPSATIAEARAGSGKPNDNNPLNLRYGGGSKKFREFPSLNDGLRSSAHQIYRYYTGATINKKLRTPAEITGLWNNEKEKGSSSASNYLKAVVQHSGLNPNEKIDIDDVADVASLMYGMAKAENHKTKVTERQIRKALQEKDWKEQGKKLNIAESTKDV